MASEDWCLASGVPVWCTFKFMESHRNKSDGFKSGDWAGKDIGQPLPVHLLSAKISLLIQVATFFLALQVAHPLNTARINS